MGSWTGWDRIPKALDHLSAKAGRLQASWEPSECQWGALSQSSLPTPLGKTAGSDTVFSRMPPLPSVTRGCVWRWLEDSGRGEKYFSVQVRVKTIIFDI